MLISFNGGLLMNEWGRNEGGGDRCVDERELIVLKMELAFCYS